MLVFTIIHYFHDQMLVQVVSSVLCYFHIQQVKICIYSSIIVGWRKPRIYDMVFRYIYIQTAICFSHHQGYFAPKGYVIFHTKGYITLWSAISLSLSKSSPCGLHAIGAIFHIMPHDTTTCPLVLIEKCNIQI